MLKVLYAGDTTRFKCAHCFEFKWVDEFHKNKTQSRGYDHWCKECANRVKRLRRGTAEGKAKLRAYRQSEAGMQAAARYTQSDTCKEYRKMYELRPEVREMRRAYRESPIGQGVTLKALRKYQAKEGPVDSTLRQRYGLSLAEYTAIKHRQDGKCAICWGTNGKQRLAVDHNHVTGAIRGLVCTRCNFLIGTVEHESIKVLRIQKYLKEHHESTHTTANQGGNTRPLPIPV